MKPAPVPRAAVVGLVALLVAAACQATTSAPSTATRATATPATAGPATAAPATLPPGAQPTGFGSTPGASPSAAGPREISGIVGVVPPGRYTHRGFEPRITFAVDGPWRSVQTLEGFFDIQQQVGSPDVIAVQFARPNGIYGKNGALSTATTADAAVAALRANDDFVVVDSREPVIAGLHGREITVENPASAAGDRAVIRVPPGPLAISPSRRLRLAFFDTPDGLLAVLVGGSVAKWDDALRAAQPVLESVTIGD